MATGWRILFLRVPLAGLVLAALVLAVLRVPGVLAQQGAQQAQDRGGGLTGAPADWLEGLLHWTIRGIEVAGIGVIVIGAVMASALYVLRTLRDGATDGEYHRFRSTLGRAILLGLEFLVAADIINTVAIDPTLESIAVLAGIVAIRTFLSFALEVEINGRWPWQKE